ncbi:MAG: lamin tail domain-containing protein [Polyangiaceae bacterium]
MAFAALVTSGFGCELIVAPDRTLITTGGTGGDTGGGGTAGTTDGGGGTGGTAGTGGTGGMPCTTPADCTDSIEECQEHTCESGMCGVGNKAAGEPADTQTAGDCKVNQCDGNGAVEEVNDDLDLPVDNEECTEDLCTDGVPSNPPLAIDSPCGNMGALFCNGNGQCVDCTDPIQCGTDTECQQFTCDAGVCGTVNAAQGVPLATQTDGDCQVEQCDGNGGTEMAEDNADLPVDATTCTDDVCTAGVPSNPPVMANTACAEDPGVLCDGNGACVECILATDCPGTDDECQMRTCTAGVCGVDFTAMGTAVAAQTGGDCQQIVCDGNGGTTSIADDADLPNDNEECTSDSCVAGAPTFTDVSAGTTCGASGVCDGNGSCVGCTVATDCPGTDDDCKTRTCTNNTCGFNFAANGTPVTAQTAGDCKQNVCDGAGNTVSQNDNADLPADDGNQCTDQACNAGTPSFPNSAVDTACTQNGGSFCDGGGACVACNLASQCPGTDDECQTRTCTGNTCGFNFQPAGTMVTAQTAGDCQVNQCDGAGAVVQAQSNGDVPVDGNQCTDDVCTAGVPSNPPSAANTVCTQNGGAFCDGASACVACNMASQCPGTDDDCQTRTCAGNTCGFNFASNGTPTSSQTTGDCKQNVCDGSGGVTTVNFDTDLPVDGNECTGDVCTSGVPSNPGLPLGTTCSQNGGEVCNGSGTCVAAGCSDGVQNGDETDIDCGGSCVTKCTNGQMCGGGADCASGICSGGVCVECAAPTDCPGTDNDCQTRTCNSNTCGFSFAGAGTPTSMQTTGDCKQNQCNGSGGIASVADDADLPVDGNDCTDDVCTAGVPSNPAFTAGASCSSNGGSVCNGTGTCVECNAPADCPGSDTECQSRTCNSNTCGTSFVSAGTATPSQTAGDCKQVQCDGAGGLVMVNLDTDLPVDGNDCTDDVCTAGVASNPAFTTGTACSSNGGSVCNGSGSCVECNAPADCPGADTDCQVRTCSTNTCGVNNTAAGTPTGSQTTGDCQEAQCDGAGGIAAVPDDADLPVDGNECTDDVCTVGVASNPPLSQGTACTQNGGTICDGSGSCVAAPAVAGTTPADGAASIAPLSTVAVTFTTAMDPATLTAQTAAGACSGSIQLSRDNFATCEAFGAAAPTMSGGNTIATLTPAHAMEVSSIFKIRVLASAASAGGITLGANYTAATGFMSDGLPATCTGGVRISQVYGAGGNVGALYTNDFIELFNGGTTTVDLSTWAVHYASSGGTSWQKTNLTGSIAPGGYYLIQEGGGANGSPLPTPDVTASISMSGTAGKVVLTNDQTALGTVSCPATAAVVDIVGFGAATNCFEGTGPTANLSVTTSAQRKGLGCTDSNSTSGDMSVSTVHPRSNQSRIAANESGAASEADYCVLQFPSSFSVAASGTSDTIYARIYEAGVTEAAGANPVVSAQIGYGPAGTNGQVRGDWKWVNATFNTQSGNDDEYQATFTAPATAGSYSYGARFTLSNGAWTYCDLNGAGANAGLIFEVTQQGTMTVTP